MQQSLRRWSVSLAPTTDTHSALLLLYRHKTWATLRVIEHCQNLADSSSETSNN